MKQVFKKLFCVVLVGLIVIVFTGCDSTARDLAREAKNLSTYKIDATINDVDKSILATEHVEYVNNTDVVLNELWFNLYPAAFREDAKYKPYSVTNQSKAFDGEVSYGDIKIQRVILSGREIKYEIGGIDNNILKIGLDVALYPESRVSVEISFLVLLANCNLRLGYFGDNINIGNWYPVVCVYENGGFVECPYYSNGDPFYSDMANYDVSVRYNASYQLATTGSVLNMTQEGEFNTAQIKAQCVRDFAMVLSNRFEIVSEMVGDTLVQYYGYQGEDNSRYLTVAVQALTAFNEMFGKYPYRVLNVAKTPFLHGGMEYPNLVFISDSIKEVDYFETVIVHEIAHQWWYGVVGNNEINDAWLDEALAEYSTILFYEKFPEYNKTTAEQISQNVESYILYEDVVNSIGGHLNTAMNLSLDQYSNEYEYVYMVYVKGVIMYQTLRESIGTEKFLKGLANYYCSAKYKMAKTDDLIDGFERATGTDLKGFFDGWLNGKVNIIKAK